jgi:hypothetical protein
LRSVAKTLAANNDCIDSTNAGLYLAAAGEQHDGVDVDFSQRKNRVKHGVAQVHGGMGPGINVNGLSTANASEDS